MIQLLVDQPILLLALVAASGYVLGLVRVGGSSLGVAAVLFTGLAFGALDARLRLPEFLTTLGLVLFVYTVGLSSGPSFFASFRRKGVRDNAFGAAVLCGAALLTAVLALWMDFAPTLAAGLFAGSLTNTPALASLLETLERSGAAAAVQDLPVVGYSLAYPVGVLGVIALLAWAARAWRVDFAAEAAALRDLGAAGRALETRSVRVLRAAPLSVGEVVAAQGWEVLFGRLRRPDGTLSVVTAETRLAPGDEFNMVGEAEVLDRVTAFFGEPAPVALELDRTEVDFRRLFVSNPKVAGYRLRDLDLPGQFGALVTRLRRGDVEWLASGDTVLELGDRIRVVARREALPALAHFFGDSYRALSEINLLSFNLGLALGLLVGLIPVPLPGDVTFRLGLAGGPLVVGLVLGRLGRTGPVVWYLPYSGNLLLRQLGLVCFFAGVGTRAGGAFWATLTQSGGLAILGAGAVLTLATAAAALWVGYRVLRIPLGLLGGMLAGLHTQPAVLSYALNQSGNDLPNVGYATVFPLATVLKILLAQLLLALLP